MKKNYLKSPLVSVYIVNHNYGDYLENAISSVLSQTLDSFEIILIDNGSTDSSREKIESYYSNKKIRIVLQENIGLNAANNVALKLAKGKYVIRLDADDFLDKNALEILVLKLEKDKKLGMVFSDYYTVDQKGNIIEMFRRHDFNEVELLDQPAHGACSMVRREFLLAINGYDESYHCQDGWDLWVRFIKKYGVANVNLPLFFYRQHNENLSKNVKKLLSTRAKILKKNVPKIKKQDKCLAIIPVRGNLLGEPSLALKKLGEKLVIDWTLDEAIKSKKISDIILTTPEQSIIDHVNRKYKKVTTYKRDIEFARFGVTLDMTLTNLFEKLPRHKNFDRVYILFIEYPFRSSQYIDMAYNTMDIFKTDRVISMKVEEKKFYKHSGKGLVPMHNQFFLKQEKDQIFSESGGIYLVKRGIMYKDNDEDEKIGHINIDSSGGININSEFGWSLAKLIVSKVREK